MSQKESNSVQILGVRVDSTQKDELLKILESRIASKRRTTMVTPNPEFLVFAYRYPWFRQALNRADFALADGVGLVMAAEFLAQTKRTDTAVQRVMAGLAVGWRGLRAKTMTALPERTTGADLFTDLCRLAAKNSWRVYLLGGLPGVADKALAAMRKKYPDLTGWAESGPVVEVSRDTGEWRTASEVVRKITETINQKEPDVVFLGWDMEKQVKFMDDQVSLFRKGLYVGVGGTFDYYSRFKRAPEKWRRQGFEWLYRLIQEPRRWRRMVTAVVVFPWLVFRSAAASKQKRD